MFVQLNDTITITADMIYNDVVGLPKTQSNIDIAIHRLEKHKQTITQQMTSKLDEDVVKQLQYYLMCGFVCSQEVMNEYIEYLKELNQTNKYIKYLLQEASTI